MNRLVVLADHMLVFAFHNAMSERTLEEIRLQLRAALPDWKILLVQGPTEVIDLRGDEALSSLASELHDKLSAELVAS